MYYLRTTFIFKIFDKMFPNDTGALTMSIITSKNNVSSSLHINSCFTQVQDQKKFLFIQI